MLVKASCDQLAHIPCHPSMVGQFMSQTHSQLYWLSPPSRQKNIHISSLTAATSCSNGSRCPRCLAVSVWGSCMWSDLIFKLWVFLWNFYSLSHIRPNFYLLICILSIPFLLLMRYICIFVFIFVIRIYVMYACLCIQTACQVTV